MRVVRFAAALIFLCAVNGRPNNHDEDDYDLNVAEPEHGVQNDNTYDYDGGEDDDVEPEIPEPILITRPQNFIAKENETVHLPCKIDNGDTLVSMWKKNNEIVFQDTIKFNSFGNNFKISNRTLVISNVGANETANYTCLIPITTTDSLSVTHQLFVQTAPKIETLKALHDVTQLDSGKTLVLTCKAIGFPAPKIKWSRKGQRLSAEGETVVIEDISHHDSGDYQCLADNNIEPPAHQFIHISVVHIPRVRLEKLTVNSDQNLDTQLICYVHAVPRAEVVWKKDGINVVAGDRRTLKHHNHTNILEISKVQPDDFGVYTCSAYNRVGRNEENVTLTGYPSPAEHVKTYHELDKSIGVVWNVESNSPISQYALEYRKKGDSEWQTASPEVSNPEGNLYTVNFTFPNLNGGPHEARLRSKNSYGWSEFSSVVSIKSGKHHHKPKHDHHYEHVPDQVTLREEPLPEVSHKPEYSFDNEIALPEEPVAMQTPAPPSVVAQVPNEENTEQKPHTQERQHQAGKEAQGKPDGGAVIVPVFPLLCIAVLSTVYSR